MNGLDKPLCLRLPRENGDREWYILISSMGMVVRTYIYEINGNMSPAAISRNHPDNNCKEWGVYVPNYGNGCSKTYSDATELLKYCGIDALHPGKLLEFLKNNQEKIKCIGCMEYVNTSIIPLLKKEIEESR